MPSFRTLRASRLARLAVATLAGFTGLHAAPCGAQPPVGAGATDARWPVKSREHVDLWLHGFAMIADDSSLVPLFRRGYRDALVVERNKASVTSDLDANHDALAARLRANPRLVNAQFLPLYFGGWAELEGALDFFLKAEGDPRGARTEQAAQLIAFFAAAFPTRDDRDFARRLLRSLESERERFFHAWWLAETRRRDAAFEAVDTLWQRTWRPKLQPFLNHTQQGNGEVLLTLPLEGEGRTVTGGKQRNTIAVGLPQSPARATEAMYALAHELVGPLTGAAVDDNTTPAEKRSGAAERLSSLALVRGGALLVAQLSKADAEGYARFYLRVAGVSFDGDAMAALAKAFPVPPALLDSIQRQIAIAFAGI